MENHFNPYLKRTQQDYSESFKVAVVREIENGSISVSGAMQKYGIQGGSTLSNWRRKFGNFAVSNQSTSKFMQTPQQRIASQIKPRINRKNYSRKNGEFSVVARTNCWLLAFRLFLSSEFINLSALTKR